MVIIIKINVVIIIVDVRIWQQTRNVMASWSELPPAGMCQQHCVVIFVIFVITIIIIVIVIIILFISIPFFCVN